MESQNTHDAIRNADALARMAQVHPCFGTGAHLTRGRVHLPVSPGCNIRCNYCKRTFNKSDVRPGVTGQLVAPHEASDVVARALELCPEISVVGIAGPGDTLATRHAIQAFRNVQQSHPQLVKCLSTNGLLLSRRLPELLDLELGTLTVTVNGVRPTIVGRIVERVLWDHRIAHGAHAALLLIENQLRGIEEAAASGLVIKVNMVLIPGINEDHVEETAQVVKNAGASLFNIIPLIPQRRFEHLNAPSRLEVEAACGDAARHLPVFRHCQHCRADACGIPGKKDLSRLLYGAGAAAETFSHG